MELEEDGIIVGFHQEVHKQRIRPGMTDILRRRTSN
jgi:hypothetical protein